MEPLESLAGLASLDDDVQSRHAGGAGSINKLHTVLSGLSRGSHASYGSLAAFHDDRSLFHAMAPQSILLSNLTRQRERTKLNKKERKKQRKEKRRGKMKKQKQKQTHKRKNAAVAGLKKKRKKDGVGSEGGGGEGPPVGKKRKYNKKRTKKEGGESGRGRKKKNKPLDAEELAAAAAAELADDAPVNPNCPPSLMQKFGKIYNSYGRVGIYTVEQRLFIMNRYRKKRTNRVWKKVVRYDCRKNLADTRLRIKGRFVRKDSEEAKAYFANLKADLVSVFFLLQNKKYFILGTLLDYQITWYYVLSNC
jgi:hypothetical protein